MPLSAETDVRADESALGSRRNLLVGSVVLAVSALGGGSASTAPLERDAEGRVFVPAMLCFGDVCGAP